MKTFINRFAVITVILVMIVSGCHKFEPIDENSDNLSNTVTYTSMSDLNINPEFNWRTTQTIDVTITLPEGEENSQVKIYSEDGTKRYFNGYAENGSNILKTRVTFPTYINNVLIKYGNFSDAILLSIDENHKTLSADLGNFKSSEARHYTEPQDNFKNGQACDLTLSGYIGNIDLNSGIIYCIDEGTTVTADKITFKGGTLNINGELIVNDHVLAKNNGGGYIYISSTGEIDAREIKFHFFTEFINYGTVTETSEGGPVIDANMLFENHGTMTCNGVVNQSDNFLNTGTMNVDGQFNNTGVGTNEGTIYVTGPNGHFNNTGNPNIIFYNHCALYVEQNFTQNSKFYHYGYIEVEKRTIISGSGNTFMVMGQFSLITTVDLQIAGEIIGPDESGAKFKVSEDTKLTGAADLSGYIQICDENGVELNNGDLGPNIDFGCDLVIPQDECNPGDNPQNPPDPENLEGTLAFEDLWPGKGDYDINDLVIEYNFEITKDINEKVEHITASFLVRAFGAGLHNGFGFSFPNVDPDDIVSVSGYDIVNTGVYSLASNGVENGQTAATFILYDDAYRLMPYPGAGIGVNTSVGAPYVEPVELVLEIEFVDDAVSYSQLDIGEFNPFIVVNQNRDIEVHLADYPPTDLADISYFGTFDDNSSVAENRYYKSHDNLFWAINIPETFDYPIEKQLILNAYYHFAEWAQSDGTEYEDWYKDLPGYRNEGVIY